MSSSLATRRRTPWWDIRHGGEGGFLVAYFSMEFGLGEHLPVYSGGLGVLAGDHLKAASDLGVPLVGVGLLYRLGYFRQSLGDGQEEHYVPFDMADAGLTLERTPDGEPLVVSVDLEGDEVRARVWRTDAGRVPLLLLDSDIEGNSDAGRAVTDVLYGGDREHRLRQEVLLGVGGPRALAALGLQPSVYHVNEGHAAFLQIERLRTAVEERGVARDEALAGIRAATVFTTHTPVPAGNERFDPGLVRRYVAPLAERAGLPWEELEALGTKPGEEGEFGLTPLALRTAGSANGVSELHGEVARQMWRGLEDAAAIGAITNGVHFGSWLSAPVAEVLRAAGVDLDAPPGEQGWDRAREADRGALDRALGGLKHELLERIGAPGLSADALTIGFARRFATYKRAGLLFSDTERLRRLLHNADRPVQLVVAGKAHPADQGGKELIRLVLEHSRGEAAGSRVIFLPDYDIALARLIVSGVDVWLNTPRRPQEACGTSGMKAALNGALNLSTLDGWWAEAYSPEIGWAIGAEDLADDDAQDRADAEELYRLLEQDVVPAFADRGAWLDRVAASIAQVGARFGADRMVLEYTERLYLPAHAGRRG